MKGMRKIRRGMSFKGILLYLSEEGKAVIIGGNMSGRTPEELLREFGISRRIRRGIEKPVWHNSLRLPKGDENNPELWNEIADDYMRQMGFTDLHQRIYWLEDHPDGQHIHIVASRIALNGSLYLGQNENLQSTAIIEQLEKKYGLTITKGRDPLSPTARPDVAKPSANELQKAERENVEPVRERLQKIVSEALADRPTLSDFFGRIEAAGAHVIAARQSTGRVTGLSFGIGDVTFKGSDLGRKFSWASLQKSVDYEAERDAPIMMMHSVKRDIPPPTPAPTPTPTAPPEPTTEPLLRNGGRQPSMQEIVQELGFVHDRRDKSKYYLGSDPYALDFHQGLWHDLVGGKGGKGGVSLVQHALDKTFGQAIAWLRDRFGGQSVSAASDHVDSALNGIKLPFSKREPFQTPEPSKWGWGAVKQYLVGRGIDPTIIDTLNAAGTVYAESKSAGSIDDKYEYARGKQSGTVHDNAVFIACDPSGRVTGAELRGTDSRNVFKGLAPGSDKAAGCVPIGDREFNQIVVCESAIDAISYLLISVQN